MNQGQQYARQVLPSVHSHGLEFCRLFGDLGQGSRILSAPRSVTAQYDLGRTRPPTASLEAWVKQTFWILPFLFGPAHIRLLLCVLLSFPVEMIQPRSRGQQLLVLVSRMNHPTPCLVHSQSSLVLPSPHGGWNLRRPNVRLG